MDPLVTLIVGLPMLVVTLLALKLIVGGGAFASRSKRRKLESDKELLDSRIKRVRQEIRDLDRQIAKLKNSE